MTTIMPLMLATATVVTTTTITTIDTKSATTATMMTILRMIMTKIMTMMENEFGVLKQFLLTDWSFPILKFDGSNLDSFGCYISDMIVFNEIYTSLTHWGRDNMDAISQTFSNALSWMKMYEFRLKFPWSLPKGPINNISALVQIMAWRHPGHKPLPMHISVYPRVYASLGLNDLTAMPLGMHIFLVSFWGALDHIRSLFQISQTII